MNHDVLAGRTWSRFFLFCLFAFLEVGAAEKSQFSQEFNVRRDLLDRTHGLRLPCPDRRGHVVALTFDDGPSVQTTPKVLDVLKKYNIKATFFVPGNLLDQTKRNFDPARMQIIERMKREGHLIGSHTYDHRSHTCGPQNFRTVDQAEQNMRRGFSMPNIFNTQLFRFPYGDGWLPNKCSARANQIMQKAHAMGWAHVGWDIDTSDYSKILRKSLPRSILSSTSKANHNNICATKGGVILMHDNHANTADQLEFWIASIHHSGHSFASVEKFRNYRSFQQFMGRSTEPAKLLERVSRVTEKGGRQ